MSCSVHRCSRSAVRAAAAHSPAAVTVNAPLHSPCGLNKEAKAEKNQLMMRRHEAVPAAESRDRFDCLIWTRSRCPGGSGSALRLSALCQPVHARRPGAGLRVFLWMKQLHRGETRCLYALMIRECFNFSGFSVESAPVGFIPCWI